MPQNAYMSSQTHISQSRVPTPGPKLPRIQASVRQTGICERVTTPKHSWNNESTQPKLKMPHMQQLVKAHSEFPIMYDITPSNRHSMEMFSFFCGPSGLLCISNISTKTPSCSCELFSDSWKLNGDTITRGAATQRE